MTEETSLSPQLTLLWGLREPQRRGPKPALSVRDITMAAVEVADQEGLAAVSMARVAAQLGNSTMALYRHVKSKSDLLMLMADAALEYPPDFPDDGDWRSAMTLWAKSVLAAVRKHPWYVQIPISGPPLGPHNLMWFDRALQTLADTGLSEDDKVMLVMGLLTYVQGGFRLNVELSAGYAENPAAFGRQYAAGLRQLVDPRQMPALSRLIEAKVFEYEAQADSFMEDDFDFGLSVYLDGVAAHIARKA